MPTNPLSFECELCNNTFPKPANVVVSSITGAQIYCCITCCNTHAFVCGCCGLFYALALESGIDDYTSVCLPCSNMLYIVCPDCGCGIERTKAVRSHDGDLYCQGCIEHQREIENDELDPDPEPDPDDLYIDDLDPNPDANAPVFFTRQARDLFPDMPLPNRLPITTTTTTNTAATRRDVFAKVAGLINSYNYHPKPFVPHGPGIQLGVEVEIQTPSDDSIDISYRAGHVLSMLNTGDGVPHVYLKSDSSIGTGFEIVTHPHDLAAQTALWARWVPDPKWMRSCSPVGINRQGEPITCGIHVHIEKSRLTPLQIGKLIVFINADENAKFITDIAQRPPNHYTRCYPEKRITDRYPGETHYDAVNLHTTTPTVELRIFRGNIRRDRIMKCIEFAAALVHWTSQVSLSKSPISSNKSGVYHPGLNYQDFVKWLAFNPTARPLYPNLRNYLIETHYIAPPPATSQRPQPALLTMAEGA